MANDKIFSVRTDEATLERLNQLAEESGMKKADILPVLLSAYETQEMKAKLPGRADDIDAFDALQVQIRTAFMNSLQLSVLARAAAEKELAVEIETKTRTIDDLQKRTSEQESTIEELKQKVQSLEKENALLNKESMEQKEGLADKEKLVQSFTSNIKNLQAQVDEAKDLPSIREKLSDAELKILKLENQMENERKSHENELKARILDVKTEMQEKLAKAQDDFIQRIQQMQDKIHALTFEQKHDGEEKEEPNVQ